MGLLMLLTMSSYAQSIDSVQVQESYPLENQVENITENNDAEFDASQWNDDLEDLSQKQVNLNSLNENELRRLFLINEQQISNLLAYTAEYGPIASVYELQLIEGFNQEIIEQLIPYICLDFQPIEKFQWEKALRYGHGETIARYKRVLEPQSGYERNNDSIRVTSPNNYYLGSPDALGLRFLYKYKDRVQYGLVAEKDPGETLLPKADSLKKGFDFYSAHLYLNDFGKLKHLAIGDYHLQFGQGLTFWSGLAMGKASGMLPQRKRATAIRPHASANEINFLRGVAVSTELKHLTITAFASSRKRDANQLAGDTVNSEESLFSSLQETGYHRTAGELADRKRVREFIAGGNMAFREDRFRVGFTAYHISYNGNFKPSDALYSQFQAGISENTFAGIDYSYSYKRLTCYGEGSYQLGHGLAQVHGLSFTADPALSVALIFRDYRKDYNNSFSAAFGEGSKNTNERGMYAGIITTPYRSVSLTAYADFFQYPWLRYRIDAPSTGHEYSAQLVYMLGRKGNTSLRFRYSLTPLNGSSENRIVQPVSQSERFYWQWQLNWQAFSWLKTGNKVYLVKKNSTEGIKSQGYFVCQDFQFIPGKWESRISFRYALFDTDSYETRMYAYENDIPGGFSVPALSGKGSRCYMMLYFRLLRYLQVWIRYSRTFYSNINYISDGPSRIEGNVKSEVECMMKIRL